MKRGDIILTAKGTSFLARGIVWWQSLWTRKPAHFQHAMRYLGPAGGKSWALSQEWKAAIKPFEAWSGQTFRVWSCPYYTDDERIALVEESRLAEGRGYDFVGILGQALRPIPLLGRLAAKWINMPWATFCSELVATTEQTINPSFLDGKTAISPQDIDDWCRAHGWECETKTVDSIRPT